MAAAQAGASVIQPNIGRLDDWYAKHPGVIRDPKVTPQLSSPNARVYLQRALTESTENTLLL